jgi:DNA polymerase-3 subunit delta'
VITSDKLKKPKSSDFIGPFRQFMQEQPFGNNYDWLQFIDAENKQGNITAAEVEDINHKMNLKSFENAYKILIIWMPEFLGKEGNKLLKLIEEPPPDTIFILVAENESLVLPTILSRTQLVRLHPLTRLDIESTLELKHGVAIKKAQQIAAVSNGNLREALIHLGNSEDDWENLLRDWMNSIIKTGPVAQLKWVEEIAKTGRENQKQFLRYFSQLIELALRSCFIQPAAEQISREQDFANRLNKLCGLEQLEAINRELDRAVYHIERNANAKILFHALTIRLYHIISNKSVILMN